MPLFPFICLVFSTLCFAAMGLAVRLSGTHSFWTAVWVRSLFGVLVFGIWALVRRQDWPRPKRPGILLLFANDLLPDTMKVL